MTDLERYLKLATWGLPRRQRDDVRSELEEHILERAAGLQAFGVPEDEAVKRALADLGPPERVCTGMNGVYLMPKLMKLTALSTIVVTLSLAGITSGGAQVAAVTQRPKTPVCAKSSQPLTSNEHITVVSFKNGVYCYVSKDETPYRGLFISLKSLEQVLRAKGVTVRAQGGQTTFRFPGATSDNTPRVAFQQAGDRFLDIRETAFNFGTVGLPVRVTGWTNPTISVGAVRFSVGDPSQPVRAASLYQAILLDVQQNLVPSRQVGLARADGEVPQWPGIKAHVLRLGLPEGTPVGLIQKDERGAPLVDVAAVGKDGAVTLYTRSDRLAFVADPKQLSPYPSNGRINALLVRLTGNVNKAAGPLYELLRPTQATSDAAT